MCDCSDESWWVRIVPTIGSVFGYIFGYKCERRNRRRASEDLSDAQAVGVYVVMCSVGESGRLYTRRKREKHTMSL